MKKTIIIIGVVITLIISICLVFILKENKKIHLEEKYYDNGELLRITKDEFEDLEKNKENFILFVHIPGVCQVSLPFAPIVEEFIKENNITIYSLPFYEITDTSIEEYVKFSPSVLIYKNGSVLSYLDSTKDEHLEYYKTIESFTKWIKEYVHIN